MFYSADEFYDDDITSGPERRNDIPEMDDEPEINFEAAAAELRAPLFVDSASLYDDGPEPDGDEGLNLPDPLDDLTTEEQAALIGDQE